jgi:glycosyltransferase involved in cell wall biosynthesis
LQGLFILKNINIFSIMNKMKKNLREEELFLVLVSFWAAVLTTRSIFFYFFRKYSFIPEISINGFSLHHYLIGLVLLVVCAVIYFFPGLRKSFFHLVLIGMSSALLFDEFSMWLNKSGDYWALENFISIGIFGGAICFCYFYLKRISSQKKVGNIFGFHRNSNGPYISVVIPAYNEEKFLAKSLESLCSQDCKNFEIIVVDNNSTDNTSKIAEKFGARVIIEKNQGVVFARQSGFMQAKGKIVATTDADTVVPNNWISTIVKNFKRSKKLVVYGGLCNLYSGPITAKFSAYYLIYPYRYFDKVISGGWSMPGANFAVRKEAFLKADGFNTKMKSYEDVDLSQRLSKLGRAKFDPSLRVETSGRRFRHGILGGIKPWAINEAIRILGMEKDFLSQPDIRTEKSLWSKVFAFVPVVVLAVFLFSLFYFSNPVMSSAKEMEFVRVKASFIFTKIQDREEGWIDYLSRVKSGIFRQ